MGKYYASVTIGNMLPYSEEGLLRCVALPWLLSCEHLQNQTSKTPNVNLGTVSLRGHHFRCHPKARIGNMHSVRVVICRSTLLYNLVRKKKYVVLV